MNERRLIEDYLPIKAISAEASREKSIRKGHISTLHLWWARRPLVACRAAVYGALVPASRFIPENGPDNKKQSLGRANAAKFVTALCKYPNKSDPNGQNELKRKIKEAQQHILEAHAERLTEETGKKVTVADIEEGHVPRPKVLDMFAGGGAIPLEALRLGCEAYALDLNPVAHIIELCTLVYPQKYGKPDPNARGITGPKNQAGETTWGGLAEEVRYWGNWVLEKVKEEIGDLYPPIPDPDTKSEEIGTESQGVMAFAKDQQQRLKAPSGYLTPVAYLWTRTVKCKNPSCGATVPLVRQTWLCKKKNRYIALKIIAPEGEKKVRFEVVESKTEGDLGFDPSAFSKGGNATCPFCGTVADSDYVKAEGCGKKMGKQLMAFVCKRTGHSGKIYISSEELSQFIPDENNIKNRIASLCESSDLSVPYEPIITDAKNSCWTYLYGLTNFSDLFVPRQLFSLLTFAATVREAEKEMRLHGHEAEQVKGIAANLAVWIDRIADKLSSLTRWDNTRENSQGTFGRQALPMVWDYVEPNPFGEASGGANSALDWIVDVAEAQRDIGCPAIVSRGSATSLPWSKASLDAVITDPPYYDNVPYADISDFFYVWLKRSVGYLYPEHFTSQGTPKKSEAVADAMRHGGSKDKARSVYEEMMAKSFTEAYRVLKPAGEMVVVYAHKTTLGWSTLVDALRSAGFTVVEAWPLNTEMGSRMRAMNSAALASSIFLVARKRESEEVGSYEDNVQTELETIVQERVDTLWRMGITGADLLIAAVGAGLRAYTRFEKVEYANGEEVPAERFLGEVEGVVLETLLEKIFGVPKSGVAAVDGPSRFYVLWRYAYKNMELDAGEAIVFSYGQPVELDGQQGLSTGNKALLVKKKGKYQLLDFTERGSNEKLGLPSDNEEPAPLIDVLHRILWLIEYEPLNLNNFLDETQVDHERLRLIAQALAGTTLEGKKEQDQLFATTASEQSALQKLLANWRSLIKQRVTKDDGTLFKPWK